MFELSELERDALTELINIGMGQAASALNELVDEVVRLSVPQLELLDSDHMYRRLNEGAMDRITGARQHFHGPFDGEAMLLFPEGRSLELVRLLADSAMPTEEMGDFEQEALTEIANVILNACIASLADSFGCEIGTSIPVYLHGRAWDIQSVSGDADEILLFLKIDFSLESERDVQGYVVLVIGVQSAESFRHCIREYVQSQLVGLELDWSDNGFGAS